MHLTKKVNTSKFSKLNNFFTHIWISDWGEKHAGVRMCSSEGLHTMGQAVLERYKKNIKEEESVEPENMILDPTTW